MVDTLITAEFQRKRERRMREGLFICLFNKNQLDRSSMEINGQFVQYQLLISCLLQMEPSQTDRREFLSFFERQYARNPSVLRHVHLFEKYQPSSCLQWYTRDSFIYRELNKALRTQNIHLLFLFRFFIGDIKTELGRRQSTTRKTLYRWQVMSNDELQCLKRNQGNYISMNSFVSTTIDREMAVRSLEGAHVDPQVKRILFEIEANPSPNSDKPFANIMNQSEFPCEREYLMMLGSIFKIEQIVEDDPLPGIFLIRMSLMNENQSDYRDVFQHMRDQYQLKSSRYLSLGYVLIDMAQFHFSQFYLQRALEDPTTDFRIVPKCYQALGKVSFENGFYQLSLEYFYRSLQLAEYFDRDDLLIAYLYNNIGEVFEKQGFYLKGLHAFHTALQVFKRIQPKNEENFAWCYNNIGMIYQRWNNFDYALFYLEETLRIQTRLLPKHHPCFGNTHNNLGNIYYSLRRFEEALELYQSAHEIFSNSLTPEHPSIARTARNLALTYENLENLPRAEHYYKLCQRIRHKILPADHPDLFDINEDLHRTLRKMHREHSNL